MLKSKRSLITALLMIAFGISGASINLALQKNFGAILFALMAFIGVIMLTLEKVTQT